MDVLKQRIYDVAQGMTNTNHNGKTTDVKIMVEQIPQNFRMLEEKLHNLQKQKLTDRQIPILTRDEFLAISRDLNNAKDLLLEEDIPIVTKFLHNIGKYRCFGPFGKPRVSHKLKK